MKQVARDENNKSSDLHAGWRDESYGEMGLP